MAQSPYSNRSSSISLAIVSHDVDGFPKLRPSIVLFHSMIRMPITSWTMTHFSQVFDMSGAL